MKRVGEFDDAECLVVYERLSIEKKRALLAHEFAADTPVAVYTVSLTFRDVLSIISNYTDLRTHGRLRQCCKLFHTSLGRHWTATYIQRYYASQDVLCRYVKDIAADVFLPHLVRFVSYVQVRNLQRLRVLGRVLNTLQHDDFAVFLGQCRTREAGLRKWFSIHGFCRVHYPTGIICKYAGSNTFRGHIFMDDYINYVVDEKYGIEVRSDLKLSKMERLANAKYLDWVK